MFPTGIFATLYFASVDPQQNLEINTGQGNENNAQAALCLGLTQLPPINFLHFLKIKK